MCVKFGSKSSHVHLSVLREQRHVERLSELMPLNDLEVLKLRGLQKYTDSDFCFPIMELSLS